MNPMQMIGNLMKSGGNPQQFLQNMMRNNQIMSNPMAKNAVNMMQNGDTNGIEQLARNICKERNINPDELMQQIKGQFGM